MIEVDRSFWDRAKCWNASPDLFFPEVGQQPVNAIACCKGEDGRPRCPVIEQCLAAGVASQSVGVWGGMYFNIKYWDTRASPREIAVLVEIRDTRKG